MCVPLQSGIVVCGPGCWLLAITLSGFRVRDLIVCGLELTIEHTAPGVSHVGWSLTCLGSWHPFFAWDSKLKARRWAALLFGFGRPFVRQFEVGVEVLGSRVAAVGFNHALPSFLCVRGWQWSWCFEFDCWFAQSTCPKHVKKEARIKRSGRLTSGETASRKGLRSWMFVLTAHSYTGNLMPGRPVGTTWSHIPDELFGGLGLSRSQKLRNSAVCLHKNRMAWSRSVVCAMFPLMQCLCWVLNIRTGKQARIARGRNDT